MNKSLVFLALLFFSFSFSQPQAENERIQEARSLMSEAEEKLSEDKFPAAEATYRKAIEKAPRATTAKYNLGTAYYNREKAAEAKKRFLQAAEVAETKEEKHKAFHNLGNTFMKEKNYKAAVEAYKNALRNNPTDDETRYNFALAKKMLEQQGGQGGDDKEKDKKEDKKEEGDKEEDQKGDEGEEEKEKEKEEGEKEEDQKGDKKEDKKEPEEGEGDQKEQQQPKQEEGKLSPQQIKSLLEAMNNQEKKVQDKINAEKQKGVKAKTEKDW